MGIILNDGKFTNLDRIAYSDIIEEAQLSYKLIRQRVFVIVLPEKPAEQLTLSAHKD